MDKCKCTSSDHCSSNLNGPHYSYTNSPHVSCYFVTTIPEDTLTLDKWSDYSPWNVVLSVVDGLQNFEETCCLHLHDKREKQVTTALVPTYQTTLCHVLEDYNLNIHCYDSLNPPNWSVHPLRIPANL